MTSQTPVIIPTDSKSVFASLGTLVMSNSTQLAIIRPNNPPPGIAGFIMDIVNDDTMELESDITKYVTSENNPIQDHIALMPEIITVGGEVAEVVQIASTVKPVVQPDNPLPLVPGMEPELSEEAADNKAEKQDAALSEQASIDTSQSLWGYYNQRLPQQPNQTKQSLVWGYIYQLWKGRQQFSVETPWGIANSMVIQSASARQDKDTKWISSISVTFVKFRVAQSVTIQPGQLAGRAFTQRAFVIENGTVGQSAVTGPQYAQFFNRVGNPSP